MMFKKRLLSSCCTEGQQRHTLRFLVRVLDMFKHCEKTMVKFMTQHEMAAKKKKLFSSMREHTAEAKGFFFFAFLVCLQSGKKD